MLQSLGLSELAETVYRAMLTNEAWGVRQLAQHLGITTKQVRQALDELAELSLLQRIVGESGPRLVAPTIGLTSLLVKAEAEVLERQRQIASTHAAIAAIAAQRARQLEHETAIRHDGLDAVRRRLEELTQTTHTECVSLNPRNTQTPSAKAASRPLNEQMLERGVAIRCVYPESYQNDHALVRYARWLTDLGGQVRTASTIPMLAIVYDREVGMLPLDPTNTALGGLEVRSPGMVAAIYALFEQIWATAAPVGTAPTVDDHGVSSQERELLLLLAAGQTDATAARRLGVSLRTVRRMVAELTDRLGARSRFQAGLEASRRGWL
jgi:DNA-binding CsgD family transcriptional regulator